MKRALFLLLLIPCCACTQTKPRKTEGQRAWERFEKNYNDKNGKWGPCEEIYGPAGQSCQIVSGTDRVKVKSTP